MIIVFEGPQNSGKSTFIKLAVDFIKSNFNRNVLISKWNSNPELEPLIEKRKVNNSFTPYTWFVLHYADLMLRYEEDIIPFLGNDGIVILDRYIETAFSRDSLKGVSSEFLNNAYSIFLKPDFTFYFIATANKLLERHDSDESKFFNHYNSGQDIYSDLQLSKNEKYIKYQQELIKYYHSFNKNNENSIIINTTFNSIDDNFNLITERIIDLFENQNYI